MSVLQRNSRANLGNQPKSKASQSIGKVSVETVLLGIVLFVSYWLVLEATSLMSLPFASISLGIVAVFLSLLIGGALWVISHYDQIADERR